MIEVLENRGALQMTASPIASVRMAKAFLLNYQAYSKNSMYGQLSSMLNTADSTKNSTITIGNLKFDITTTSGNSPLGNLTTFTWSYTSNGINTLDKCVSLGYKDGFLSHFIDTWDLRKIGSTTVKVSEQQAEEIAMENAKTYAWTVGGGNQTVLINNFNLTKPIVKELIFSEVGNKFNARDSDQLALYPLWHIGVGLDKYYPGNVYGIYVDIWADTGQIKNVYEVFSTLPPPVNETATIAESSIANQPSDKVSSSSFPSTWTPLALLTVIAVGAFPIWLLRKKILVSSLSLPIIRKISATVLCVLIGTVALLSLASAVPTADAAVANVWGETAAGSPYLYHTTAEITAQTQLSSYIDTWFGNAGYAHNNFQENGQTTKSNVLWYTGYHGQIYPSVATVYFDHGIGTPGGNGLSYPYNREWHYQLCTDLTIYEDPSQNVFDYQLWEKTATANQYFSYISCCHSASLYDGDWFYENYPEQYPDGVTGTYGDNQGGSGNIIGMPYAWTHGASMSTDGFADSDTGKYCYIGFVEGSAALCQDVDNRQSGTVTFGPFVYYFFDGLLNLDLTVHDALNHAAHEAFPPEYFAATELYQGFMAEWPTEGGMSYGWGKMVVYGNSYIYLYPGGPDYVTTPTLSGVPSPGMIDTAYQFIPSATDPYGYAVTYTINWGDGSDPTVTSNPYNIWHTWTSAGIYTITVTAQSQTGVSSSPNWYSVRINSPDPAYYWLTVNAVDGTLGYPLYPDIYIDGNYAGYGSVTMQVLEGYHSVWMDDPTYNGYWQCWSYLSYYSDYYGNGDYRPIYSNTEIFGVYY